MLTTTTRETSTLRFLHLSDLHYPGLPDDGTLRVDPRQHLRRVIQAVLPLASSLSFVLVSGDLVDRSKTEHYRQLRRELAALDVPVVLALGNHDDLDRFSEVFGHSGPTYDHAMVVDQLHVLTLDSHVPHQVYGELSGEQLRWLETELAHFPDLPKVLQIHHPPVFGKPQGARDEWHHLTANSSEQLRQTLAGYQVIGLFSGHVHTDQFTLWHGIPCFCSAGLNNTTDVTYQGGLRALRAASFHLCTLYGRDLRVAVVPVLALDDELFTLSAEQLQTFDPPATNLHHKEPL